jgi:hypothetical protein
MVNIEIECKDDYSAKKFERGETLRYYLKGPQEVSNEKGEIGMFDLKGRYAGKFKGADGARVRFGLVSKAEHAKVTLIAPSGEKIHIGDIDAGVMSTQERITLGMCLNNATELMAAQCDSENQPQDLVTKIFDLTDTLYAEYNLRYNS